MGSWRKLVAIVAAGIACLGGFQAPALAQGPLAGLFQKGPPPQGAHQKEDPFSLPDRGEPNAFTTLLDVRAPRFTDPLLPRNMRHQRSWLPGIFHPALTPGVPAEFPNPACEPNEPASPWTVREEGMANAFVELHDPRPRHFMELLRGRRLLFTEFLEPAPRVVPDHMVSVRGEYLQWRLTPGPSSAVLLTTNANPNLASLGQLGDPNTAILVGSGEDVFDYNTSNGYRLALRVAPKVLPPIEISYFRIRDTATPFSGGSLTNPTQTLSIPFQNIRPEAIIPGTNVGVESAVVIALPVGSAVGAQGGTVTIASDLKFWGLDAVAMIPLGCSDMLSVELVGGYKHVELIENLRLGTVSGGQVGGVVWRNNILPQGLFQVSSIDNFSTTNKFDGALLGVRGVLTAGRLSLYGNANLGIGMAKHTLSVSGSTSLTEILRGQTETVNGGILALPTNSGTRSINLPAVIPEVNLALSFQATQNLRAFVGLNYLYWTAVGRPGDFIDTRIDERQFVASGTFATPGSAGFVGSGYTGPALATPSARRDFTAVGFFFGIEIGF